MSGDGEVEILLRRLATWAMGRSDVRGLALVGSWARGQPQPHSDVDLVLLSTEPAQYVEHDEWVAELDPARLVRTASWGAITERRFALPSGVEVDLGVGSPAWASINPIDPGTRRVVEDGVRILHDPDGALAQLVARVRET
ncbi:MAG TPA: nucleotidyltransferase domain-containing protein [Thermoleophilaceae bacterium]